MRALAALAVLLLLASPVQADWLQVGVDAARTGSTKNDGPLWPDLVHAIRLPMAGPNNWTQADPIVVGDQVYVAGGVNTMVGPAQGPMTGRLVSVGLLTRDVVELPLPQLVDSVAGNPQYSHVKALASNGTALFALQANGHVSSFDLASNQLVDEWQWSPMESAFVPPYYGGGYSLCNVGHLALTDDALYATCDSNGDLFVWKFSFDLGLEWEYAWVNGTSDPERLADATEPLMQQSLGAAESEAGDGYYPMGLSIIADHVIVPIIKQYAAYVAVEGSAQTLGEPAVPRHLGVQAIYLGLDAAEGSYSWKQHSAMVWLQGDPDTSLRENYPPAASGHGGKAYMELGPSLLRRDLAAAATEYVPLRPEPFQGDPGSGVVVASEGVYATSRAGIHLYDDALGEMASWHLPDGQVWGLGSPVRTANDLVLARHGPPQSLFPGNIGSWGSIQVLEARTLRPMWSVDSSANCTFAVSDGLLVHWCSNGMLRVFGASEASLGTRVKVPTRYPAVAQTVHADLGATRPSPFGAPTVYRASWGDGTETDWQSDPVLTHKYNAPGDWPARFYARNEDNQTSSVAMVFHAGQHDPAVQIWDDPWGDRYQNTSFFFLGLLVTFLAAMAGLYRSGRKRRLLEQELRALQAIKEEYGDDVDGLMDRLVERRQRAHQLYMDRKLEDGHLQVLEHRIDELAGRARLGRVEEECGFLPVVLARSLEGMLRDGRISSRERSSFLAAVDAQAALTRSQKNQVHRLVEEWFERDAAQPSKA